MENIESLLERFSEYKDSGIARYFDSEEIISLVDHFTEEEDIDNLQIAIDLGYELHPDNVAFKIQLCGMLMDLGDYETALKAIQDMDVDGDKEVDMAYIECLCELRLKEEAIAFVNDLGNEDSPYYEDISVHMARVLNDIDEYIHFAHGFISERIDLFPDNDVLKIELCFNLELQGRIKEAMTECEKLLQVSTFSAELWFMKGRLHTTYCDYGKAVEALSYAQACLNEETEDLKCEILMLKANCFMKNENYYSAIDIYKDILSSIDDIDTLEIISQYAECLIMVEEFDRAYHIMIKYLTADDFGKSVSVFSKYVFCCIMTDRRNEAVDVLYKVIMTLLPQRSKMFDRPKLIDALQSDMYHLEDGCQDLVRSYVNSNLHVN